MAVKVVKKRSKAKKIVLNIEQILDLLIDGKTYREIAKKFGVGLSVLHRFTSKEEHSARVRDALNYSASTYADKAEQILLEAPADKIEIQRARELAQHYRWKAGKRDPKKYGDSTIIKGDEENPLHAKSEIKAEINISAEEAYFRMLNAK